MNVSRHYPTHRIPISLSLSRSAISTPLFDLPVLKVSRSHDFRIPKEVRKKLSKMEVSKDVQEKRQRRRLPLKAVVAVCVKRWFDECLIAAEAGDPEMQVLVGQMFNSGYGVERDPVKGSFWLEKARSSRQQDTIKALASSSG